ERLACGCPERTTRSWLACLGKKFGQLGCRTDRVSGATRRRPAWFSSLLARRCEGTVAVQSRQPHLDQLRRCGVARREDRLCAQAQPRGRHDLATRWRRRHFARNREPPHEGSLAVFLCKQACAGKQPREASGPP